MGYKLRTNLSTGGRFQTYLQVKMKDVLLVKVVDSFTYLFGKQDSIQLGKIVVFIYDPVK